jgi:hypothetical protein
MVSRRITSMYASQRTTSAYDALASAHGTAAERLANALRELSLLRQHRDQFSERGRQLFDEILATMEGRGEWPEALKRMHHSKREQLATLVGDLFHDTQAYVHEGE